MLRAAISRLGARLRLHHDPRAHHPSPASPPLRALSTRRGKRSSPTASPAEYDDEGPLRGLFVLSRDPESPPRLLVVQPRLRPGSLLDSKLAEALNLANSLEEPRDGFYDREFGAKGAPPHLVVQNPASRGRSHAGIQLPVAPFPVLSSSALVAVFSVRYAIQRGFVRIACNPRLKSTTVICTLVVTQCLHCFQSWFSSGNHQRLVILVSEILM
jgi:hypothetical protein